MNKNIHFNQTVSYTLKLLIKIESMKLIFFLLTLIFINPNIPDTNKKIHDFIEKVMGQKVGRGECWDLAAAALDYSGAYFDRSSKKTIYVFGKKVNPKKEKVFPGDIIQIENVKIKYTKGNTVYTETMSHHTAIIYEVLETGIYQIAHQNTSFSGKTVGLSQLRMDDIQKGTVTFYRPFKN